MINTHFNQDSEMTAWSDMSCCLQTKGLDMYHHLVQLLNAVEFIAVQYMWQMFGPRGAS